MKNPRVLGVVTELGGCSYYRIIMPFSHLYQRGQKTQWVLNSHIQQAVFRDYDVIVLGRVTPRDEESMEVVRQFLDDCQNDKKKVVFEIDDDLFSIPKHNPGSKEFTKLYQDLMKELMIRSNLITVTNEHLRNQLLDLNPQIKVLPNCVDPDIWTFTKDNKKIRQIPGLTIGVHGGDSHTYDWMILQEVLPEIVKKYPHVQIIFAGFHPEWLDEMHLPEKRLHRLSFVPIEHHPLIVSQIDIGLCPLIDNTFNKSKSPIKFYEHSMARASVVASPTVYGNVITHGVNGFLAQTVTDWIDCISKLVESPDLRRRMGEAARGHVLHSYNIHELAPLWMKVYREAWERQEIDYGYVSHTQTQIGRWAHDGSRSA